MKPGDRLGPYEVLAKLGEGGMGEVYRARDTQLKRDIALKVLPGAVTADAARLARFEREAELLAALNHPHIVTIHAILENAHGQAIVMELVQGRTLRVLAAERPSVAQVVRLGAQVATALAAAHAAGLVHRDLKPENVMVRDDGYVKVLDFGLARLAPDGAGASAAETNLGTAPGVVMGTWRYMAPEQGRGEAVTGAADVFALGLVLYELATGRHAFEADSNLEVLHRITSDPPAPASRVNPTVPAALDALIAAMLEKEPRRRPTAAIVAETLTALEARVPTPAPTPVITRARPTTVGRRAERAALLAAFETVAAGRGQVVGIAGEAGIGKTTLVEDFVADLGADGRACTLARGRCSERLAGTEAYLPWLEALESLVRGDGGPARASLLRTVAPTWYAQVMPLAPDDSSAARLLADVKTASQERLKRELAAFLEELGRPNPVVLFFDDLHWADASTVDLLAYVAGRFDQVRALVVVTYRPTELALTTHPFAALKLDLAARGLGRELTPGFLTRDEVEQYVGLIFPDHRFPPAFAQLVHAKTEGNPLFAADLLRELRDRRVLAEEDGRWVVTRDLPEVERELPTSVRSLIERKIAQVGDADRRLLQAASVQGCDFDSAVVAHALGLDAADVEERLETLERVHALVTLVEETSLPDRTPNLRGRFVHVLYQNALYESLAPSRRASLCRAVAEALLAHHASRESEVAAPVALLFEAARDDQRAASCFDLAARSAASRAADHETVALAERGLRAVRRLVASPESRRQELALNVTLGHALLRVQGFGAPEALRAYERVRALSRETGARSRELFAVLGGLVAFRQSAGDIPEALRIAAEMQDQARHLSDAALEAIAVCVRGQALFHMGRLTEARALLEASLAGLPRTAGGDAAEQWVDWRVSALNWLSCLLVALGHPDRGAARSEEAVDTARHLNRPFEEAFALLLATYVSNLRCEWATTRHLAELTIEISLRHHFPSFPVIARCSLGRCLAELGDPRAAVLQIERSMGDFRDAGFKLNSVMLRAWLAAACAGAGQIDAGLTVLGEALADASRRDERWYEAEIHRLRGSLLVKHDPPREAEAEQAFLRAIDVARAQEARWWELRASVSLGRLWQRQGRSDEARSLVANVYNWFTEGFESVDLKEARALLEGLEDRPQSARSADASIVVLPFANLSSDPEQEYFSDGLTEEVIADLSKVRALRVISRTSAMKFKGTAKGVPEIARELNVRHVLEGSVRKSGHNLRITAQLIDAATDTHLWAEKYSGTLDDVFAIQEQVSRAIVGALRVTLAPDENRKLEERPLSNGPAYDAYLRARQDYWRWNGPALERALGYLQSALAMVGDAAPLYVGLGNVYANYVHAGLRVDEQTIQQAEQYAQKALQLQPDSAEARLLLASVAMLRGKIKDLYRLAMDALSLSPRNTDGLFFLGSSAFILGQTATIRSAARTLLQVDPLSPFSHLTMLLVGLMDEGPAGPTVLASGEAAYRLDPDNYLVRWWHNLALVGSQRFDEAQASVDRWVDEAPGQPMPMSCCFWLNAVRGRRDAALACIDDGWIRPLWEDYWLPLTMAEGFASIGDSVESLKWLERAVEKGWINYRYLARTDPWLEGIRGDPRFQDLMVRVKREWEAFEV